MKRFTKRESDIVNALKKTGSSNKIIAHELGMTEGTVKVHLRNIMRKLNVTNRTSVAVWANQQDHHHERVQEVPTQANSRVAPVCRWRRHVP